MHCYVSDESSGTTVTFVIIEGSVITVASVGDSRCILESADGGLYYLSADHRLDCSEEEYANKSLYDAFLLSWLFKI